MPLPAGRSFTLPFAFGYDSNSAHHFEGGTVTADNAGYLSQGGWSYILPMLSYNINPLEYQPSPVGGPPFFCPSYSNYIFTDDRGTLHPLGLSLPSNTLASCASVPNNPGTILTNSDGVISATSSPNAGNTFPPQVVVTDGDGGVYYFLPTNHIYPGDNNGTTDPDPSTTATPFSLGLQTYTTLPTYIEDRNGNKLSITDSGKGNVQVTDDIGRTVLTTTGFGISGNTVAALGLGQSYKITWANESYDWAQSFQVISPSAFSEPNSAFVCTGPKSPATANSFAPEITNIALPNGQSYQFQYDPTYGTLSKMIYPTGGYIRYTWEILPASMTILFPPTQISGVGPFPPGQSCEAVGPTIVLQHRYVSFDGVHEVLQQDFVYPVVTMSSTGSSGGPFVSRTEVGTCAKARKPIQRHLQHIGWYPPRAGYSCQ